jgi:hypothetical protein
MITKSRESIYGSSIRHWAERAAAARKEADRLACEAWNQRMLGYTGPAQPSPALGDALNAGYLYLVRGYAYKRSHLVALRYASEQAEVRPTARTMRTRTLESRKLCATFVDHRTRPSSSPSHSA